MANKIQETGRNPVTDELTPPTSRYAGATVINYGLNSQPRMTFKIYKRKVQTRSPSDKFMVIRPGYEYRPDKVSKELYGVEDFWWKIMEYNNMKDIMEFKVGTNITLPSDILF